MAFTLVGLAVLGAGAFTAWSLSAGLQLSLQVRLDYWLAALKLIADQPWLGYGIDGFRLHNWEYLPLSAEWSRFPHNTWLMLAITAGVALPILAFLLVGLMLKNFVQSQKNTHKLDHSPGPAPLPPLPIWASILCLGVAFVLGGYTSDNLSLLSSSAMMQLTLGILGAALATGISWPVRKAFVQATASPSSSPSTNNWLLPTLWALWIAWLLAASIDFHIKQPVC